jgi:hypothetical protein
MWKAALRNLEDRRKLEVSKSFNKQYAKMVSNESLTRLYRIESRIFQLANRGILEG